MLDLLGGDVAHTHPILTVSVIILNFFSDLLYFRLDPRISE